MNKLLSTLSIVLLANFIGFSQVSPEIWASNIAKTYDKREMMAKMNARKIEEVVKAIDLIGVPLMPLVKIVDTPSYALTMYTVVKRFDPFWKSDMELNNEFISTFNQRIVKITPEIVKEWLNAFNQLNNAKIDDIWTAIFIARTGSIFGPNGINDIKSNKMLTRLKIIPDSTLSEVSKLLNTGNVDVAIQIAENDTFFDASGQVKKVYLERAIAALRVLRKKQ